MRQGRFSDPLLLVDADTGASDRLHEYAHLLQLLGTSSGALFTWGWAIVLSLTRMLRKELERTGYRALRLPFTTIDPEALTPRAAALLNKLTRHHATIARYESPYACALQALTARPQEGTDTCPWVRASSASVFTTVSIGARAVKEASAELAMHCQDARADDDLNTALDTVPPETPGHWPLAYARDHLRQRPLATTAALLDLALMAPPDPAYTRTPFKELHVGHRFLQLVQTCATRDWQTDFSQDGYCSLAHDAEQALGWRTWQENARDLLSRVVPRIKASATTPNRARAGGARRRALAHLLERGMTWRLDRPGALARPGNEWLETAVGLAPLVAESGTLTMAPLPGTPSPALHEMAIEADTLTQLISRTTVQCLYQRTNTTRQCPSFEATHRCAVFPNPPEPATACDFHALWRDLQLPTHIETRVPSAGCTRCFASPRPRRVAEFIASCEQRLPPDHLGAAYGGTGAFNPCLALVHTPRPDDPLSQIDTDHELTHAIISSGNLGKALFLLRFLTLHLWYTWAHGHLKTTATTITGLDSQLDSLVQTIARRWTPAQEGVAWRETHEQLKDLLRQDPDQLGAAAERYRLMTDVITLAPRSHPVVSGWRHAEQLDDYHGPGTARSVAILFTDPKIPRPTGSLSAWLASLLSVAEQVIAGIATATALDPVGHDDARARALELRDQALPRSLFGTVDAKRQDWHDALTSLLTHPDLPDGYAMTTAPLVTAVRDGCHGRAQRSYGLTRIAFQTHPAGAAWEGGPPRIHLGSKTRPEEEQTEHEINQLAALDFLRARHGARPARLADAIREHVPAGETFTQVLHDLFPFYTV